MGMLESGRGGRAHPPPPPHRILQAADILASLCGRQPSGIFQDFPQGLGDFDLGTKGLPFLLGEDREVLLLSSEHLYLHSHPVHLNWG